MKRFFITLLSFLILAPTVQAFKLDIQVEKTRQTPGYLSFTIFPPKDPTKVKTLILDEVYVQNYTSENAEQYKELVQLIQEFGGKIVPALQADQWYRKPYIRVIVLGNAENIEGDAYFVPDRDDFENLTESFVAFASTELQPAYLQGISILGEDDNFVEVYPEVVNFLGDEPIRFVGKFKEARPMKVVLQAIGPDEILQAKMSVDFDNIPLINNDLPEIWDDLQKSINPAAANSIWFNVFPIVLGILGLLCLLVAFRLKKKEEDDTEESLHEAVGRIHETIDDQTLPFDLKHHSREQVHKVRDDQA